MVIEILNSQNFIAGLDDAIAEVGNRGFNTDNDKITVVIQMNGNTANNGDACVDTFVYVNESDFAIGTDIITG